MRKFMIGLLGIIILAASVFSAGAAPAQSLETTYTYLPLIYKPWTYGDMVEIPKGDFWMGCDTANNAIIPCEADEKPVHLVTLKKYWIDRREVTNAEYAKCVAAGMCPPPQSASSATRDSYYFNPVYANYPVINIYWNGAFAYCQWAGKRLPTEAEWEKAARGAYPDNRIFPWGDIKPTCDQYQANFFPSSGACYGDTIMVGSLPAGASSYGVLDLAGNVGEWVNDYYDDEYYTSEPVENPTGPATGLERVIRGGSWNTGTSNLAVYDRSKEDNPNYFNDTGFRCAISFP